MKRSPMPPRTAPLARARLVRQLPLIARRRPSRKWRSVRLLVLARSEGLCECCGLPLDPMVFECHHRKLRSQGGTDDPHNLLALLPGCHRLVHRGDRVAAERAGLIVPSHADPARVPLLLHGTERLYLAGVGYAPVQANEGGP